MVDCPEGTSNCNDEDCLIPSIKGLSEAYKCEFECISGRGENGSCALSLGDIAHNEWIQNLKDNIKKTILWILIVGSASLIGYFILWKKLFPLIRDNLQAKKEIEENTRVKEKLENKLEHLKSEIGNSAIEIESLKKEIRESRGLAREKLEKELNLAEKEQEHRFAKIKSRRDEMGALNQKIREEIEESDKLRTVPHLNKQKYKVTLNENGYEVMQSGTLFHIFWYCKNSNEKESGLKGFNIHHIDGDKRNNEYWNLIKIKDSIHSVMHRYEVRWKDYLKGANLLKKYDIKLPERVKNRLRKIEKSRKRKRS